MKEMFCFSVDVSITRQDAESQTAMWGMVPIADKLELSCPCTQH
jgi:hypothetical protein